MALDLKRGTAFGSASIDPINPPRLNESRLQWPEQNWCHVTPETLNLLTEILWQLYWMLSSHISFTSNLTDLLFGERNTKLLGRRVREKLQPEAVNTLIFTLKRVKKGIEVHWKCLLWCSKTICLVCFSQLFCTQNINIITGAKQSPQ